MKKTALMRNFLALGVLIFLYANSICSACKLQNENNAPKQEKDWWQTAQFYQIYPRSFKDSDGDGIGDLKGITSQLEYLKDIGVTAAWLSPIFKSPMVDFGYDISDFYDIQQEYGTMDDFRELIQKANSLGLKIILDFVPNHSSNESEWFKKSVQRERGYVDYYVWADGKLDAEGKRIPPSNWQEYGTMDDFRELIQKANSLGLKIILDFVPNHSSNESEWFKKSVQRERGYVDYYVWADGKLDAEGKRIPPSNWIQGFRGSAWEWREERQQYYLHQFAVQQADLNYRNPAVVEQMKRILRFWLEQGVAGFRVDAVPVLFEVEPDAKGQYPDAELSGVTDDKDDRAYLKANLVENRPETIDMVYQWRQVMDDHQRIYGGDTRVLLIETYAPPDYTMQMYGNRSVEGAHLPFNFNLITMLKDGVSAPKVHNAVDHWLNNMPAGRTANWVIGNHDQRRAASRYGIRRMDAMNMLVMTLPGASVTYQGEELGMIDGVISWEDTVDPAACNSNSQIYERFTRDPSRTPFHWSAGSSAGFSTSAHTWLPLAPEYETLNVVSENASPNSHLKIYKSLVQLRKSSKTLQNGAYKYQALNNEIFVLKRYLSGENTIIFIANFGESSATVDLQTDFDRMLPKIMNLKITSLESPKVVGTELNIKNLSLAAGEALVLWSQ